MHYSAKRSIAIAIACRLSVTLVDQDNILRKSWKLIALTISLTTLLFVAERPKVAVGRLSDLENFRGTHK